MEKSVEWNLWQGKTVKSRRTPAQVSIRLPRILYGVRLWVTSKICLVTHDNIGSSNLYTVTRLYSGQSETQLYLHTFSFIRLQKWVLLTVYFALILILNINTILLYSRMCGPVGILIISHKGTSFYRLPIIFVFNRWNMHKFNTYLHINGRHFETVKYCKIKIGLRVN